MNKRDIIITFLPELFMYLSNIIKVGLCIFVYFHYGLVWSVGLALFFLFNLLSSIERGVYDVEEAQKEMNQEWNHIYSSRKRI